MEDMIFKLMTEMTDSTGNGPRCGIAKGTNRIAFYLAGNINEEVNISHVSMTAFYAMQNLFHPAGALAARTALSATFMMIKLCEVPGIAHDAGILIKDNKPARTKHG